MSYLFDKGRDLFANGGINWTSDTIKAALVTSSQTPNQATDQYYSTYQANVVGTPQALAGKSTSAGVCDCNPRSSTWTAVTAGASVRYVLIYKDTGTPSSSPLIALIDNWTGMSVPVTSNGGDITINYDSGPNKIFKL